MIYFSFYDKSQILHLNKVIFRKEWPYHVLLLSLSTDLSPLSSWVRQKGPFMRNLIFGEPTILSHKLPTLGGLTHHSATSQRNQSPLSASRLTLHTEETDPQSWTTLKTSKLKISLWENFYPSGQYVWYNPIDSHFNQGLYPLPTFAQIRKKSTPEEISRLWSKSPPGFQGLKAGGMEWSGWSWDG